MWPPDLCGVRGGTPLPLTASSPLRASPLFAAMAVLSLALGIGANTAIYSWTDAILVKTLPVRDPEALAVLQCIRLIGHILPASPRHYVE